MKNSPVSSSYTMPYGYQPLPIAMPAMPNNNNHIQPGIRKDTLDLKHHAFKLNPHSEKSQKEAKTDSKKKDWLLPVSIGVGAIVIAGITLYVNRENEHVKPFLEKITEGFKEGFQKGSSNTTEGKANGSGEVKLKFKAWTEEEMAEAQQWFEEAGLLIDTDPDNSINLLQKAADRNHLDALYSLGISQYTRSSFEEALATFSKGSYLGIQKAQVRLANMYKKNQPVKAYLWACVAEEEALKQELESRINEPSRKVITDELVPKIKGEIAENIAKTQPTP